MPREIRGWDQVTDAWKNLLISSKVWGVSHLDLPVLALTVQCEQDLVGDLGDVHGDIQCADDAAVAVGEAVLDMVQCRVDEDAVVIPSSALQCIGRALRVRIRRGKYAFHIIPHLDTDGLVHSLSTLQLLISDDDGMLAKQRYHAHVIVPDHILDIRRRQLSEDGPLLHIKQGDLWVWCRGH